MAVTDIVETKNGRGVTGSQTAWSTARNATTATATVYTSTFSIPNAIEVYKSTSRGPSVYGVTRTFFFFDLSSLPSGNIISAIDLKIQGFGSGLEGDGNVRVARATAFGGDGTSTYTATDFDNWSPSSPTPYASNISNWYNVRNTITLNSTAISDANTNGYLNLVLVDNVYDYPDTSPTSDDFLRNGIKFLSSTTSEKNIVTVTHAAAPSWEDTINGIPLKNQDKINGVLVSAIENVL